MVTITKVAKTQETLVEQLEDRGGDVTYQDEEWGHYNDEWRPVFWEVEVYFPDEIYDVSLEMALEELVESTGWVCDLTHDDAGDEKGVSFERHLKYE